MSAVRALRPLTETGDDHERRDRRLVEERRSPAEQVLLGHGGPGEVLALQRSAGNAAVTALLQRGRLPLQRDPDGVTIEDVEDEAPRPAPRPAEEPPPRQQGPLLLTDVPWSEIETRQRERAQADDPRWTEATRQVAPKPKDIRQGILNRRERQLGTALRGQLDDQRLRGMSAKEQQARGVELTSLGSTKGAAVTGKHQEIEDFRAASEASSVANESARLTVEAKRGEIETKYKRAVSREVTDFLIDVSALRELNTKKSSAMGYHDWSQASELLESINDESAKLLSYAEAFATLQGRITKLPQGKKKNGIAEQFRQFQLAARKPGRDDTAVVALLGAVTNEIQVEEDRLDLDRSAATARAAQRAEGLWPGNGRPAALIQTRTRVTLGSTAEERAAVVETLDAVKDSGKDHSWARKWGDYHGNGEGNLPGVPGGGGYKEYYVRPDGNRVGTAVLEPPGRRRVVVDNSTGFVYYSDNHYGDPNGRNLPAFVKVTDA